jgi:hypothetical protein
MTITIIMFKRRNHGGKLRDRSLARATHYTRQLNYAVAIIRRRRYEQKVIIRRETNHESPSLFPRVNISMVLLKSTSSECGTNGRRKMMNKSFAVSSCPCMCALTCFDDALTRTTNGEKKKKEKNRSVTLRSVSLPSSSYVWLSIDVDGEEREKKREKHTSLSLHLMPKDRSIDRQ